MSLRPSPSVILFWGCHLSRMWGKTFHQFTIRLSLSPFWGKANKPSGVNRVEKAQSEIKESWSESTAARSILASASFNLMGDIDLKVGKNRTIICVGVREERLLAWRVYTYTSSAPGVTTKRSFYFGCPQLLWLCVFFFSFLTRHDGRSSGKAFWWCRPSSDQVQLRHQLVTWSILAKKTLKKNLARFCVLF